MDKFKLDPSASAELLSARDRLLRYVRAKPACDFTEAARGASLPRNRTEALARELETLGQVLIVRLGKLTCMVPNDSGLSSCIQEVRVLRDPVAQALYRRIRVQGRVQPEQLIRWAFQQMGLSRDKVRRRLGSLKAAKLVHQHREDRLWTWIRAIPAPDPAVRAFHLDDPDGLPGSLQSSQTFGSEFPLRR